MAGRPSLVAMVVCASLACAAAGAAPVVSVMEDFTGPLVGWPDDAQVVEDPERDGMVLRWEPEPTPGPKFIALNFADRDVRMMDWDRFVFDYKFEQEGANWWGVKITDYPFADGMQATWRVADRAAISPGEWQTASVDLRNPMWLWGERPNHTRRAVDFRVQMDEGRTSVIFLDNIRLERDPLRIESVEADEAVRDGDMLRREFDVTLANTTDRPLAVGLALRDVSPALSAACETEEATAPANDTVVVRAQLSADLAGPDAPEQLAVLTTRFTAWVKDMDDTEKTAELSLAIPLGEIERPVLLITREQAAQVMAKVEADENMRAIYDALKRRADGWLDREPDFPDRGSQWWHWYTCKECGARLSTKSPTEHVCPDCDEVYTGWPYDDVVLARQHSALAHAIRDLGLMYVLTGETPYADKAREILVGYAEMYPTYPLHNIHGEPRRGGGHVGPQTLDEAVWLIPVVQGFDCVYDTLSAEDIEFIAENMLLPAARLVHDHAWGIHNIPCWHAAAYGLVGLTLGEQTLAADAINGSKGFRAQVEHGIMDDGFWYESAWGYHYYTMMALQPLAIAAYNVGIDVYCERYKSMYDAPLEFMAPGGELPAFNDSGTANALGHGSRYEVAYARWQDPRHLLPILHGRRNSLETLLFGVQVGEAPQFVLRSTVFPATGYVLLRSGAPGEAGADRYVPENYLALGYGPHGGGHGHPDKLGFVLYGRRALLAEDPGCIAYGNPAHLGWYKQTISHNTVIVNGRSQEPCTGTLQFAAFGEDIGICSTRADDAYPAVRLRRSMALVGDRVIDVFLCEADQESTFDWAYHNRGDMTSALPLEALEDAPEGDGYEWAKEWAGADTDGPWSAVWRLDDGPGLALAQAAADGPRTVLAAVGMGNPPRIKVPFVVSRQEGRRALFVSAMEIFDGETAPELDVRILPVTGEDALADGGELPVAVEVTGGDVRDVMLVNPAGGTMQAGEFELHGQGALLRYRGDRLEGVVVVGEGQVRVGGRTVTGGR